MSKISQPSLRFILHLRSKVNPEEARQTAGERLENTTLRVLEERQQIEGKTRKVGKVIYALRAPIKRYGSSWGMPTTEHRDIPPPLRDFFEKLTVPFEARRNGRTRIKPPNGYSTPPGRYL